MPLYEYECGACGHRFEVIQKFSDSPIERCPLCAEPVHKLLSAPAIQFKGTGWYVTDYASKRNTDAAADASSSKSADNAKTPSSTSTSDSGKTPSSSSTPDSAKTTSSGESSGSKPTAASDSSASKADTKSGKSLPE
jgi:putative FmdB family regulatory protein